MNDGSDQNRADGEPDRDLGEEMSPQLEQAAEQGDEVLQPVETSEGPARKSKMPPSRIAFLVFVVVAAVAIVVELSARRNFTRSVEALDQALEKGEKYEKGEKGGSAVYRKDLDELFYGSPSKQYDEKTSTETFTWRGIRAHRLEVEYGVMEFVSRYKTP